MIWSESVVYVRALCNCALKLCSLNAFNTSTSALCVVYVGISTMHAHSVRYNEKAKKCINEFEQMLRWKLCFVNENPENELRVARPMQNRPA
jgi:hypothetical protein